MTEVMFDMAALILEQVDRLVFHFPAGSAAPDEHFDMVAIGLQ